MVLWLIMTLRIVQLTDLHLGPRLDDKRWEAFERLLADLPRSTGGFDRLVITGDVATRGQRTVYEALRVRLGPLLPQLLLVPGNHDNGRLLREVFQDRMLPGPSAGPFLEDLDGIRLIGLDSSRPWRVSGTVGKSQRTWLLEVLTDAPPALLFVHHPPLRVGTWWLDKDRLRDHVALADVVGERGVLGIFCGHVHQEFQGRLGSVPVWTTPSTAYQFKARSLLPRTEAEPSGVRLIEVADALLSTSVMRVRS